MESVERDVVQQNAEQIQPADASTIQAWCANFISGLLEIRPDRIDPNVELDRLGLDSATAVTLVLSLEELLGIELTPELLFEYPTLASFSQHVAARVSGATQGIS